MRYMQLSELLDQFRVEARLSANVAHGVQNLEKHKALLRRVQEELYLSYDWPSLATTRSVELDAGQRYASYPDDMVLEGIELVHTRGTDGRWTELTQGIGIEQLNLKDSDADARSFPILRWANYVSPDAEDINANMFEVWPLPDRAATVRFAGRRRLFPLTNDAHVTTLDGPLIALFAAVEVLAPEKAEDANLKLQLAKERKRLLGLRQKGANNRPINMAGGAPTRRLRPGLDYIPG